jgi:integrase
LGNKDRSPGNYIFPVLQPGLSELHIYDHVQNFVGLVNYWIKEILQNLGIDKKSTTYVARHTFSTVLKRSGASTSTYRKRLDILASEQQKQIWTASIKKTKKNMLVG